MAAPVSRRVHSSASFIIRPNTMRHIILDENIDMTCLLYTSDAADEL